MSRTSETPSEVVTIKAVRESGDWWEIDREDGWTFALGKSHGITPQAGQTVELWGGGIGFPIRGIRVNGVLAFYRTASEEQRHRDIKAYGRDAADYLRKWDEAGHAWSISMGGFGPGYEQALQLAMFEALRIELDPGATLDHDSLAANKRVRHLGLSGNQAGAAMSLARAIASKGPIEIIKGAHQDRRIQVSANAPSLAVIDAEIARLTPLSSGAQA